MNSIVSRTKAILHPVRARIVMTLGGRNLTARQIARYLDDPPLGTLYRHLNLLLAAGVIEVTRERRVHGTLERQFGLVEEAAYVRREDLTPDDVMGLVTALTSVVQSGFGRYVTRTPFPFPEGEISFLAKSVYLTDDEAQELRRLMRETAGKLEPRPGTRRRLIAFFSVPDAELPLLDDEDEAEAGGVGETGETAETGETGDNRQTKGANKAAG